MKNLLGLWTALFLLIAASAPCALASDAPAAPEQQDVLTEEAQKLDPELKADILRLMKVTGSSQMGQMMGFEMAQQVMGAFMQSHPGIDEKTFEIIKKALIEITQEESAADGPLMSALATVYAKYYTPDEIRKLLEFYDSPVGKKALEVMPKLGQDGMLVGKQYSQIMGKKMIIRMQERLDAAGIDLEKMDKEAVEKAKAAQAEAQKEAEAEKK